LGKMILEFPEQDVTTLVAGGQDDEARFDAGETAAQADGFGLTISVTDGAAGSLYNPFRW